MKKNVAFLILILMTSLIFFHAQPVFSQTADEIKSLKDEIKALKEAQIAIQKDLQEIKNLLRTRQAQPQAPQAPGGAGHIQHPGPTQRTQETLGV